MCDYSLYWIWTLHFYTNLQLHKIQNNTSSLVLIVPKTDHTSPYLASFHWLPIDSQCSMNLLLFATTASIQPPLASWLNSLKFTNQSASASYSLFLILPCFVFPMHTLSHFVRDTFLMLHHLSGTISFAELGHQTHSYLSNYWNLISSNYPVDCMCVHVHVCVVFLCTCTSLFGLYFGSLLCNELWLCSPNWEK